MGAGVSGLVAGLELKRRGFSVQVLDASDDVGGRVRTDAVDGFLLDRGGVAMSAVRMQHGLYFCGDHCGTASLNGAMLAGRRAAEAVCGDFGQSSELQ